jgi:hypothetical protein
VRLRQAVLVARDLEPVVGDLRAVFGLGEPFHDPGVAEFGLRNAVLPVGDTFLEVVSPVRPDATAARFLARRGGDGGYMVILQTDDLDADRRRLAALGVRVVWEIAFADIATAHLHPRDVGGAIVSLDEAHPPASWRWAGPGWEARSRRDVSVGIAGVEVEAADPAALAARWSEVLGLPAERAGDGGWRVELRGGAVRFVPAPDGRGDGVSAVRIAVVDPAAVRSAAAARGVLDAAGAPRVGGVRFDLDVQA